MTFFDESESVLIHLQGRLDSNSGTRLQQQLATIEPRRHSLWMLDMAQVDFIDSAGLVALVSGLNAAKSHQCRLVICNPHPSVRLIFEITQLDQAFEIVDGPIESATTSPHFIESFTRLGAEQVAA